MISKGFITRVNLACSSVYFADSSIVTFSLKQNGCPNTSSRLCEEGIIYYYFIVSFGFIIIMVEQNYTYVSMNYERESIIQLPRKYKRGGFIDSLRLHVTGGSGGSGLQRYGGIGGAGGNVYVVAKEEITLENVKSKLRDVKLKAYMGGESNKKGLIGTPGSDLNISVPTGISIYDENHIKLGNICIHTYTYMRKKLILHMVTNSNKKLYCYFFEKYRTDRFRKFETKGRQRWIRGM